MTTDQSEQPNRTLTTLGSKQDEDEDKERMLHAPSALLSSRPRPPRPRSNQLSSSLSRSTSDPTATAISASSILNSHIDFEGNEDINRLVPLMLPGLETPPYTPPLPSLEVRLEPCSKGGEHEEQLIRSAEQLESMLEEAHRTIEERERGTFCVLFLLKFCTLLTTSNNHLNRP